ncbi:type I secretion system permease/ATPase [Palleronia caenipelagi]|uniref:Type I secretion system permease/ATPase n=1 Tax=Palleronia caenipelagi TaxID=2489174 RepID=A0A547Q8B4_9RHOB|nr:type I secretion system permease/ATPase [Palleronia caenipelagi]TRD22609.1 type I secretion system permease/ATPase [Palleronia caenipelagi]
MKNQAVQYRMGREELNSTRSESRGLFWAVAVFSFFVNLLMLTGPLFMLQIYDRVLSSRSEATLVALTLLMIFLFMMMGFLDFSRNRILSRIGARFQSRLDKRVFSAMVRRSAVQEGGDQSRNYLGDLEAVQRFISSPVLTALFDLPWTPLFILIIFAFHPYLGWLALLGGAVLICIAFLNQMGSKKSQARAQFAQTRAERLSEQIRKEAEMVRSLGMQDAAFGRWHEHRQAALENTMQRGDVAGGYTSLTKTLRLLLQSAMLALGAWLVLQEEMTPGAMIAGSIMLGRALAPIDLAINQWQIAQRAQTGWKSLAELLGTVPEEKPRTALPRPKARLTVDQLTVIPPGQNQASLRMISFDVQPGEAVGVIGPSGSGKSTLARAIVGVWRAAGGKIRLDGGALEQYEPEVLGRHIGYLPQRVQLFDGTIAENIARLQPDAEDSAIVEAAKRAAAHEMILQLPDGYDTPVTSATGRLSGGQMQRIGLARAMFGDPVILVLDEPNSNLDNEGSIALNTALEQIKARGGAVIIMAHRPSAIQSCDRILVVDQGMRRAFGPKNEVLQQVLQNHQQVTDAAPRPGGIS